MSRAVKFTASSKQIEFYSDFLANLELNPITEQLARATNENAVGNSIKQLVLTNLGERFYQPNVGSMVQLGLFEPDDLPMHDLLKTSITNTIQSQEPRANLQDVRVHSNPDNHLINIQVIYSLKNVPGVFTTSVPIRVR